MSDVNKKNGFLSVISNHRLERNHEMNWNEIRILDTESSYSKRLVSEMIFVKKQPNGFNKQSGTDLLSEAYLPIIDLLSPSIGSSPSLVFSLHWRISFLVGSIIVLTTELFTCYNIIVII